MSTDTYSPDFIERNGVWLLTLVGAFTACFAAFMSCILKSRCRVIQTCCFKCERDVLELEAGEATVRVNASLVTTSRGS